MLKLAVKYSSRQVRWLLCRTSAVTGCNGGEAECLSTCAASGEVARHGGGDGRRRRRRGRERDRDGGLWRVGGGSGELARVGDEPTGDLHIAGVAVGGRV